MTVKNFSLKLPQGTHGKKLLSWFMALMLAFTMMPLPAFAAETTDESAAVAGEPAAANDAVEGTQEAVADGVGNIAADTGGADDAGNARAPEVVNNATGSSEPSPIEDTSNEATQKQADDAATPADVTDKNDLEVAEATESDMESESDTDRYWGDPILKDSEGNTIQLKKIGLEEGARFKWTAPGGNVYVASLPYGAKLDSLSAANKGWFDVFHKEVDSNGEAYVDYNHLWSGNTIDALDSSIFESYRSTGRFLEDAQFVQRQGNWYSDLLDDLSLTEQPSTENVEGLVVTFIDEASFGAKESWTIFIQISTKEPEPEPDPEPEPEPESPAEEKLDLLSIVDVNLSSNAGTFKDNGRFVTFRKSTDPDYDYDLVHLTSKPGSVWFWPKAIPEGMNVWAASFTKGPIPIYSGVSITDAVQPEGTSLSKTGTDGFFYVCVGTEQPTKTGSGATLAVDPKPESNTVFKVRLCQSQALSALELNYTEKRRPDDTFVSNEHPKAVFPFDETFAIERTHYTTEVPYAYDYVCVHPKGGEYNWYYLNDAEEPVLKEKNNTATYYVDCITLPQDAWREDGTIDLKVRPLSKAMHDGEVPIDPDGLVYTITIKRTIEPAIMTQPVETVSYELKDDPQPQSISVIAANGNEGTLSYQWYKVGSAIDENGNAIDEPILGATDATFEVPVMELGSSLVDGAESYYCVVTNTFNGESRSVKSATTKAVTHPTMQPTLQQADGDPIPDGGYEIVYYDEPLSAPELEVLVDEERGKDGTWAYQWGYWETSRKFVNVDGLTAKTAAIPLESGAEYARDYACCVTYTDNNGASRSYYSDTVTITKKNGSLVPTVVFKKQPYDQCRLTKGKGDPDPLVVEVEAAGGQGVISFSYQWQQSSNGVDYEDIRNEVIHQNINGIQIRDANQPTLLIDNDGIETWYRCCVVATATTDEGEVFESEAAYSNATHVVYTLANGWDFKGNGTEADPYLIETTDQLLKLRDYVNGYQYSMKGLHFLITNDLVLPDDWQPLGSSKSNKFCGTIDGGGHLITVPANRKTLLGYTGEATLKNLNIYGSRIDGCGVVASYEADYSIVRNIIIDNVALKSGTRTTGSGFIGGYASGINDVVIRNCTVEPDVIVGVDGNLSGIGSFGGEFNGSVENCKSWATVRGIDNVGGLVGVKGQSMGDCKIINSVFYGTVQATGNAVGGILGSGYVDRSAPNTPCASVINCAVYGTVEGANYVGGIFGGELGVKECWDNGIGTVKDNYFGGQVKSSGTYVGGIIGYMESLNRYNQIQNNMFADDCGVTKGIGGFGIVDTDNASADRSDTSIKFIASSKYHRTDDPLGKDASKLTRAASASVSNVVDDLNAEGGIGNWITDENGIPCHSDQAVPLRLSFKDVPSRTVIQGSDLNIAGLQFKVLYTDGTVRYIDGSQIEIKGLDKNKAERQWVNFCYGALSVGMPITVEKRTEGSITVTFMMMGDDVHQASGDAVHTLKEGGLVTWIPESKLIVPSNATVLTVVTQAAKTAGMTFVNDGGNYITSVTYKDKTLSEFTNGPNSGWMYTINDTHSDLGVAEQYLNDGDVIVFHWSDDYTKETAIGGEVEDPDDPVTPTVPAEITKIYQETGAQLAGIDASKLSVSSTGGEWLILGLARAGAEVPQNFYDTYVAKVAQTLADKDGVLHSVKYTEYSRVVLGLSALGCDVTNVGGYNLLEPLANMAKVTWQGINGPIFALLAYDAGAYEIPTAPEGTTQTTREGLIDYILNKQLADGGWALSGASADPDMTAMAIQALAPYRNKDSRVAAAIDKAIQTLSSIQRVDGGYASWGTVNAESCAQVVVALCSLGIDPVTDERFVKDNHSVLEALASFAVDGGGFSHVNNGGCSQMATEQGYYALAAYHRFKEGKTSLYDMTDVVKQGGATPIDPVDPTPVDPVDPKPVDPVDPVNPVDPVDPTPVDPVDPADQPSEDQPGTSGNEGNGQGGDNANLDNENPGNQGGDQSNQGDNNASQGANQSNGNAAANQNNRRPGLSGATYSLGGTTAGNLAADNADPEEADEVIATAKLIDDDANPLADSTSDAPSAVFPWWYLVLIACGIGAVGGVCIAKRRSSEKEEVTTLR